MYSEVKPLSREELIDERCFEIGEIYYINDSLINIPNIDRLKDGSRKIHEGRMVVIVHHNEQNYNKFCPVVAVAPLSSRIDLKRPFDLIVNKDDVDGNLKYDSIIQLQLIQPVLKVDLERCIGRLKEYKIEELIAMQLEMIGIE